MDLNVINEIFSRNIFKTFSMHILCVYAFYVQNTNVVKLVVVLLAHVNVIIELLN